MCGNSCLVTTAYILLLLAVLACALSYVAPFWLLFPSSLLGTERLQFNLFRTGLLDRRRFWAAGLWAACINSDDEVDCGWFWDEDWVVEKKLPGWC